MNDEYILAFKYKSHDPSCVISKNGKIVFGIEEERLNRVKHAFGYFPINSIKACLDYCNISLSEVNKIVVPDDPELQKINFKRKLKNSFKKPLQDPLEILKNAYLMVGIKKLVEDKIYRNLLPLCKKENMPPIQFKSHHLSHAASAFHFSDFNEALVLTVDGSGEYDSTVIWEGKDNHLKRIYTYENPNSIGNLYGGGTGFLGYRPDNGEYKVMGLAAYGKKNQEIENVFNEYVDTNWNYDVTKIAFGDKKAIIKQFEKIFNRERKKTHEFTEWDKSFAYHLQKTTEKIMCNIVKHFTSETGLHNICIAGGVGLNCKMNKKLMELDCVENMFVQPIAHDAGLSLGALISNFKPSEVKKIDNIYLGTSFSNDYISDLLETNKIEFKIPDNLLKLVANEIANGKLVGWFQGRMEMGPRALGNRSILADPRTQKSKDRVNHYVKHRENWRPFAPSIMEEFADEYLCDFDGDASFMVKTFNVKNEHIDEVSAVVHPADFTTRPQTVNEKQNPRYYNLIKEFYNITGIPILLNTSFNDHGEPIVHTPTQALRDFYGMGLDLLVINDIIISKRKLETNKMITEYEQVL